MAQVQHLVSFVRTAEHGSFSAAARVLGLTPAGVSKNVARLEADLGVRLFQRSTRRLALTESGERFLRQVDGPLASLQAALSGARRIDEEPTGTLKVSMGQAFGRHFLVPLLEDFLARYPRVLPDWHFDNRRVDIVGEGLDAAVGASSRATTPDASAKPPPTAASKPSPTMSTRRLSKCQSGRTRGYRARKSSSSGTWK